jgi:retron-type reverse transcriptase
LAWKKAKKGKTKKDYVIEFEKNLLDNLLKLQEELKSLTYKPGPLKTFILRDPKIRKISKSDFRDRIVHHALCNIIEPIFDKTFIYDSCANRKGKGNLKAVERFYSFMRKVSRNGKINGWFNDNQVKGYCFKADIKHYFQEVEHRILIRIIRKKIEDEKVIWLIEQILSNHFVRDKGMPLGNLTSQFFANVYLNELDYFVKHKLKAKYYLRYVDDFVILHSSKSQLEAWKGQIDEFLSNELKLEIHKEKSKIIPLSRGIDFVGFRNFYYFKLLRKRNLRKVLSKIECYKNGEMSHDKMLESFQGWQAYAKWANTYKLRENIFEKIVEKMS